jgi:hypothetical protein
MNVEQEKMLREVHECLLGNAATDNPGIVKRVKALESYRDSDKKLKAKIAGGLFISVPIVGAFIEWIKHKFIGI